MCDEKIQVYDPFEQMTFTYDRCFLCGEFLDEQNYSEEHIFPKWLQKRFDLWNKELVLLNETTIKYKNLKIPCCFNCNNIMGSNIEKLIEQGVSAGYDEFIKLDKKIIFQWLNKISYGMLFKELSLKAKLNDPSSDTIYKDEYLKEHKMQHLFLRSIISNTVFINNPCSILIFKIDDYHQESYWAFDNPFLKTFFIRMNDVGIISHLMDNGYGEGFFMYLADMRELLSKTLHPIQFEELCAKFLYKSSLFYREPFYSTLFDDNNPHTIISHPLNGDAFDEWDQEKYACCLYGLWERRGFSYEDIYKGDGLMLSFLRNEDGSFKDFFAD